MTTPSRRRFIQKAIGAGLAAVGAAGAFKFVPDWIVQGTRKLGERRRKWVMVIDLERCDGCQDCTAACIEEHLVPPAWSEPSYKGKQEWIKVHDFGEDLGPPGRAGNYLPAPCMQCENAPCVKVCPVDATYHNEDGIVLIDHNRCIGCRFCMAACPYERRYFNWGEPHTEEEKAKLAFAKYSPEYPVPHKKGTVEKCMFCAHRVDMGRLPACVEACTKSGMKAIFFGDANEDVVSNGVEVLKFSDLVKSRLGMRWKDELGTKPSVYYLPPRGK